MNEEEKILDALKSIPADCSYTDWVQVGMALKNEGLDCSVWDDWSKGGTKYEPGECQRKWDSFHNRDALTAGTIIKMAQEHGWKYADQGGYLDWNDTLRVQPVSVQPSLPVSQPQPRPVSHLLSLPETQEDSTTEFAQYLQAVFHEDEYVSFVTDSWLGKDGKYKPGHSQCRTAGELITLVRQHPGDLGAVIGNSRKEAGAWIRANPVDGKPPSDGRKGCTDANITAFRHVLVECDTLSLQEQYTAYIKLHLPIAALVSSGGKSLHAIVRVDAPDAEEYRKRADTLFQMLKSYGVSVDTQNRNPSRLSRLPGVARRENHQALLATHIGAKSWDEWREYIRHLEGEDLVTIAADGLPEEVCPERYYHHRPRLLPELIEGILRVGHKMIITGASKAGKSFLLIELCIALAEGLSWLGHPCRKSRVLYLNFEIDASSFLNRLYSIYDALKIPPGHLSDIRIMNLRGFRHPLAVLIPNIIQRVKNEKYDVVILDPLYKLLEGDENNATEMARFCSLLDSICSETGCALITVHHHSKGAQGDKRAMDRGSGSGVFARDADALLDIIQLSTQDEQRTAWRMESTLREFPDIRPINFWFKYPIHVIDDTGTLKNCHPDGSAAAKREQNTISKDEERKRKLDNAYEECAKTGSVTVNALAGKMRCDPKTVRSYIQKSDQRYQCENGVVTREKER